MKGLIRLFFKIVRAILTPPLLLWDALSTPKGMVRPEAEQQRVDQATRNLVLYQFRTCPFCMKARRAIKRLSLDIETRDAQRNPQNREALLQGGGKLMVPCLKITGDNGEVTWLYESNDIIRYLEERFA